LAGILSIIGPKKSYCAVKSNELFKIFGLLVPKNGSGTNKVLVT